MNLKSRLDRLEKDHLPATGAAWCNCEPVVIYQIGELEQAAAGAQARVCPVCGKRRKPDAVTVLIPDNGR